MTAVQLLNGLRAAGCRVEANGPRLSVRGPVPPTLKPALVVAHTGVRSLLTGRGWWGCTVKGRFRHGQPILLNPAALIPADVFLLAVEGEPSWDRIPASARLDVPHLFTPATPTGKATRA